MKELSLIAIGSAPVNNVALSQFLELCPFLGVSKKVGTSAGMGAVVIFVIIITSAVTSLVYTGIFVDLHPGYLQTIILILVTATLTQFVEVFLKKSMPPLYEVLGVYLPPITINCMVLGAVLTSVAKSYNFVQSIVNDIDISVGFIIVTIMLAGVREKVEHNDASYSSQESPIVLITSGLMAITFFGFSGLI